MDQLRWSTPSKEYSLIELLAKITVVANLLEPCMRALGQGDLRAYLSLNWEQNSGSHERSFVRTGEPGHRRDWLSLSWVTTKTERRHWRVAYAIGGYNSPLLLRPLYVQEMEHIVDVFPELVLSPFPHWLEPGEGAMIFKEIRTPKGFLDTSLRMIYADWLEEQSEYTLADVVRQTARIIAENDLHLVISE